MKDIPEFIIAIFAVMVMVIMIDFMQGISDTGKEVGVMELLHENNCVHYYVDKYNGETTNVITYPCTITGNTQEK